MAGIQSVGVPESMAEINDVMNVLPPRLSERLLIEYPDSEEAEQLRSGIPQTPS